MAAHYYPITKNEMDQFLTSLGFVPLKLKGVVELVYAKLVRTGGHRLSLRCYTAVNPDGESREKGTDAIRFRLFMRVDDGIVPVGRPQKCLRVQSWRVNLRKAIERVVEPSNFRLCPACGNPMVVRQNKFTRGEFWGCSLFRLTGCQGKREEVSLTDWERTPAISPDGK
ncbi:MAG: hypothetical protein ACYC4N_12470 [Pirellulaceae bacterium]